MSGVLLEAIHVDLFPLSCHLLLTELSPFNLSIFRRYCNIGEKQENQSEHLLFFRKSVSIQKLCKMMKTHTNGPRTTVPAGTTVRTAYYSYRTMLPWYTRHKKNEF